MKEFNSNSAKLEELKRKKAEIESQIRALEDDVELCRIVIKQCCTTEVIYASFCGKDADLQECINDACCGNKQATVLAIFETTYRRSTKNLFVVRNESART